MYYSTTVFDLSLQAYFLFTKVYNQEREDIEGVRINFRYQYVRYKKILESIHFRMKSRIKEKNINL